MKNNSIDVPCRLINEDILTVRCADPNEGLGIKIQEIEALLHDAIRLGRTNIVLEFKTAKEIKDFGLARIKNCYTECSKYDGNLRLLLESEEFDGIAQKLPFSLSVQDKKEGSIIVSFLGVSIKIFDSDLSLQKDLGFLY
jgi:hypothetical protein